MGERSMSGRIGREKLGPGDCDQEHLQNGAAEEGFKNSQDPGPNVSRKKWSDLVIMYGGVNPQ